MRYLIRHKMAEKQLESSGGIWGVSGRHLSQDGELFYFIFHSSSESHASELPRVSQLQQSEDPLFWCRQWIHNEKQLGLICFCPFHPLRFAFEHLCCIVPPPPLLLLLFFLWMLMRGCTVQPHLSTLHAAAVMLRRHSLKECGGALGQHSSLLLKDAASRVRVEENLPEIFFHFLLKVQIWIVAGVMTSTNACEQVILRS